ncbi:MAG TPA: HEAT repeat domain-containing protein [Gemmatimonadaceae bacterium]|nr:HEAT repeat domain-containing protein [Gemmatimonadaceae bacterium]
MSYGFVGVVIGLSQVGLATLAGALDYARRSRASMAGTGAHEGAGNARRLLSGEFGAPEVLAALRSASNADTAQALVWLGLERVRPSERVALVEMLRREPWVRQAIDGARSLMWWKRLAAARTLSLLASAEDRATILQLLSDSHPAVQSAATTCLNRYADEELLTAVIDGLSSASSAVRAYQLSVLRGYQSQAGPMLLARIRADAPPHKLYAYIHAAAVLEDADCMARIASLSTHPHPEVRVAVARVLRRRSGDTVQVKLLSMLRDSDWRVRAQAARALSGSTDERTVQELSRALTDSNWWVRFRAGLALASMGPPGKQALSEALDNADRYARDMAMLVIGLSEASVAELSTG